MSDTLETPDPTVLKRWQTFNEQIYEFGDPKTRRSFKILWYAAYLDALATIGKISHGSHHAPETLLLALWDEANAYVKAHLTSFGEPDTSEVEEDDGTKPDSDGTPLSGEQVLDQT